MSERRDTFRSQSSVRNIIKKNSGVHPRVSTLIQPSFQKKKKKNTRAPKVPFFFFFFFFVVGNRARAKSTPSHPVFSRFFRGTKIF